MNATTIIITVISSSIFSSTISVLLLRNREKWIEEKARRISVVFDERYSAYKELYGILIRILDYSENIYICGKEGHWVRHNSMLESIIKCDDEIKYISTKIGLIIENDINKILDSIHIEVKYYREIYKNYDELPEEASISTKYYNKLIIRSENIRMNIERCRVRFKQVFLKKY